ncbi:hypothetical protein ACA910_004886 [Epithemia clementina (nom. ined.)]
MRRQSFAGPLHANGESNKTNDRRTTFSGEHHDKENGVSAGHANSTNEKHNADKAEALSLNTSDHQSAKRDDDAFPLPGTPARTPSKSHRRRTRLPESTSGFYFKGLQKTPSRGKVDASFDRLSTYDGSMAAAETSFLSRTSTNSSSDGDNDMLNQSVLSDTTELTASNFVLITSSKQRFHYGHSKVVQQAAGRRLEAAESRRQEPNGRKEEVYRPNLSVQEEPALSLNSAARPPLSAIDRDHSRRHTVGQFVSSKVQQQNTNLATTEQDESRRESWHGPSPQDSASRSDINKQMADRLVSSLRSRRKELAKQFPRLSNASNNVPMVKESPMRLSGISPAIRGLGSPAVMENNRVVKRGKAPSMTPESKDGILDTSNYSLFIAAQDGDPKRDKTSHSRRNTASSADLMLFSFDDMTHDEAQEIHDNEDNKDGNPGLVISSNASEQIQRSGHQTRSTIVESSARAEGTLKADEFERNSPAAASANGQQSNKCFELNSDVYEENAHRNTPSKNCTNDAAAASDSTGTDNLNSTVDAPNLKESSSDPVCLRKDNKAESGTELLLGESTEASDFDLRSPDSIFGTRPGRKSNLHASLVDTRNDKLTDTPNQGDDARNGNSSDASTIDDTTNQKIQKDPGLSETTDLKHGLALNSHRDESHLARDNEATALSKSPRDKQSTNDPAAIENPDDTVDESDLDLWENYSSQSKGATSPQKRCLQTSPSSDGNSTLEGKSPLKAQKSDAEEASSQHNSAVLAFSKSPREEVEVNASKDTEISSVSLLAESSGLRITPNKHKNLTPTKLKKSPRRIVNPQSPNSPAQNTRSKTTLTNVENNYAGIRIDKGQVALKANTPSHENDGVSDSSLENMYDDSSVRRIEDGTKRQNEHANAADESKETEAERKVVDIGKDKDRASSSIVLVSSLRKTGRVRKNGISRKSVAFGSPEILSFNISSPSMSATPMPGKARRQTMIPDDTVEIERDMKTMFERANDQSFLRSQVKPARRDSMLSARPEADPNNRESKTGADADDTIDLGGKFSHWNRSDEEESDMDMSAESPNETTITQHAEDQTVGLEDNMVTLLAQTESPDKAADTGRDFVQRTDEQTVGLEDYRATLLTQTESPQVTANTDRGVDRHSEDQTVGLEDNMAVLLAQTESPQVTANAGRGVDRHSEDQTVGLEDNMAILLAQTESPQVTANAGRGVDRHSEDQTVGLEDNMAILLAQTQSREDATIVSRDFVTSKRKLELDPNGDEDNTVELEWDMNEVLAHVDRDSNIHSSESLNKKRRKSVGSLRRFSVMPQKDKPMDYNDSNAVHSNLNDESGNSQNLNNEADHVVEADGQIDKTVVSLKPGDVLGLIRILKSEDLPEDMTATMNDCFGKSGNFRAIDGMVDFLEEVCNQLKTGGLPAATPDFFGSASAECRDIVLNLQRFVRTGDQSEIEQAFGRIASAVGRSERIGWLTWFVQGSEQFLEHTTAVVESMINEQQNLKTRIEFIERSEKILFDCERKKVQKARRKSLERRKVNTSTLKEEVQQIEEMIIRAKTYLEDETSRKGRLLEKEERSRLRSDLGLKVEALRLDAVRAEKTWAMMNQISVWHLSEVTQERMSLSYIGSCFESCATISLKFNNTGDLLCKSSVAPSLFSQGARGRTYPPTVAKYWHSRNEALCSSLTFSGEQKASLLKHKLRSNAWMRCRLEVICSELRVLHRRYDASVDNETRENGAKSFVVHVRFSRFGSQIELISSFELTEAYPFGSLNTKIKQLNAGKGSQQECIDMEGLMEAVAKNARPGFFYLTRTVSVLSALYRQSTAFKGQAPSNKIHSLN